MKKDVPKAADELQPLRLLIRRGRLFEVQKWIQSGHPVFIPECKKQRTMDLAVETGFHSMVEVLAQAWTDQESLNLALRSAVWKHRVDIASLLIEHGANIWAADLGSVAACYDPDFMRFYLEKCVESGRRGSIFEIATARVQRIVRLIKESAPLFPDYKAELSMALKYYVDSSDAKWVSLTLWMGADARMRVPDPR